MLLMVNGGILLSRCGVRVRVRVCINVCAQDIKCQAVSDLCFGHLVTFFSFIMDHKLHFRHKCGHAINP